MLCSATSAMKLKNGRPIRLTGHVFNDAKGWQQLRARPQPTINLTVRTSRDDYMHSGATSSPVLKGGSITAIAATGCQSCLIGLKTAYRLGFKNSDFIAVKHNMKAVNKHSINIAGAVLLRLSGFDSEGYPMETAQVCYVTPDNDNMYLSREACVDLGLISPTFPIFGQVKNNHQTAKNNNVSTLLETHIFLTARLAALEVADRALLNQCYHPPIGVGRMV